MTNTTNTNTTDATVTHSMPSEDRVVLITARMEQQWLERLRNEWPHLRFEKRSPRADERIPEDLWSEVEVLFMSFATPLPTPEQAPNLRWVQLYSAGADYVFKRPLFQSDVTFTSASGVHSINIAEYVLTAMLSWFHRLPTLLQYQQRGQWAPEQARMNELLPSELRGKTLGVVGYGSIGREVARLATAFGMRVLAMQRGTDHRDSGFQFANIGDLEGTLPERYYTFDQLHTMLGECDVVLIAVPLTDQTRGMFNAAAFQAMKPKAFLVNIARGGICDEHDLLQALKDQQIAGAALDVFQQEPLPSDSPFWHLPNVFISPHITGLTPVYNDRVATIFAENLRRYLAHEPLFNIIDKARGY